VIWRWDRPVFGQRAGREFANGVENRLLLLKELLVRLVKEMRDLLR